MYRLPILRAQVSYDVPKYSKKLGIVRKCDLAMFRLAVGRKRPPARRPVPRRRSQCRSSASRANVSGAGCGDFLAAVPDPAYTVPTTHYVSQRTIPEDVHALNQHALRPEPTHWPLDVAVDADGSRLFLFRLPIPRPTGHYWLGACCSWV